MYLNIVFYTNIFAPLILSHPALCGCWVWSRLPVEQLSALIWRHTNTGLDPPLKYSLVSWIDLPQTDHQTKSHGQQTHPPPSRCLVEHSSFPPNSAHTTSPSPQTVLHPHSLKNMETPHPPLPQLLPLEAVVNVTPPVSREDHQQAEKIKVQLWTWSGELEWDWR